MTSFAVIDFETTNRLGDRRATELGIGDLDADLGVDEEYSSLVNPGVPEFRQSLGHARLRQDGIDQAPSFSQVWTDMARLISGKVFVMHNAPFDRGVLGNEFETAGIGPQLPPSVCTLEQARVPFSLSQECGA